MNLFNTPKGRTGGICPAWKSSWMFGLLMSANNDLAPYAWRDLSELRKSLGRTSKTAGYLVALQLPEVPQFQYFLSSDCELPFLEQISKTRGFHSSEPPWTFVLVMPEANIKIAEVKGKHRDVLHLLLSAVEFGERRGLALWGHGDSLNGIVGSNGSSGLSLLQLRAELGRHSRLELLVLDACSLGGATAMSAVAAYTDAIVASQALVPAEGMNWAELHLEGDPVSIGRRLADAYAATFDWRRGWTIAVVDGPRWDAIKRPLAAVLQCASDGRIETLSLVDSDSRCGRMDLSSLLGEIAIDNMQSDMVTSLRRELWSAVRYFRAAGDRFQPQLLFDNGAGDRAGPKRVLRALGDDALMGSGIVVQQSWVQGCAAYKSMMQDMMLGRGICRAYEVSKTEYYTPSIEMPSSPKFTIASGLPLVVFQIHFEKDVSSDLLQQVIKMATQSDSSSVEVRAATSFGTSSLMTVSLLRPIAERYLISGLGRFISGRSQKKAMKRVMKQSNNCQIIEALSGPQESCLEAAKRIFTDNSAAQLLEANDWVRVINDVARAIAGEASWPEDMDPQVIEASILLPEAKLIVAPRLFTDALSLWWRRALAAVVFRLPWKPSSLGFEAQGGLVYFYLFLLALGIVSVISRCFRQDRVLKY